MVIVFFLRAPELLAPKCHSNKDLLFNPRNSSPQSPQVLRSRFGVTGDWNHIFEHSSLDLPKRQRPFLVLHINDLFGAMVVGIVCTYCFLLLAHATVFLLGGTWRFLRCRKRRPTVTVQVPLETAAEFLRIEKRWAAEREWARSQHGY